MKHNVSRPSNLVSFVLGARVRVENVTPEVSRAIRAMGGMEEYLPKSGWVWALIANDAAAMASLLGALRDLGCLFEGETAGWPPAAVFRDLRDQGLVSGKFQEVMWHGPGRWLVRTV